MTSSSTTHHPRRPESFPCDAGFTIIEVLVAALIIAVVAAGAATAFVGVIGTSGIQRNRSAAEALAQQDEGRLRGETVSQLANLDTTLAPVTLDGTQYTVHESATFVSDASGTPSCSNPSADYLETTSTVSWSGMPSVLKPVTVTGLVTPTAGDIGSAAGTLAVEVENQTGSPLAGMPVSVSGPQSASGVTASNGCVIFGNLTTGSYTVNVTPSAGTYVDGNTGQTVNPSTPDSQQVTVSAGTTAASPKPFLLTDPGAATFSFSDAFPSGVAPSPAPAATSPSVILASSNLSGSGYLTCSAQDMGGCPAVSKPDTSWTTQAWSASGGGSFTAQPLAPYTYRTYAGVCGSDDPTLFGGNEVSAAVTSGHTTAATLPLAAMVVRLWSGPGTSSVQGATPPAASGTEEPLPTGSKLVITDTGCSVRFVGGPNVTVPSGDSALPLNSSPVTDRSANDIGVLAFPGMPDGRYSVCYQSGAGETQVSTFVNAGDGEIVNLYAGATTLQPGTCTT